VSRRYPTQGDPVVVPAVTRPYTPRVGGLHIPPDVLPSDRAKRVLVIEVLAAQDAIRQAEEQVELRRQEWVEALRKARKAGVTPTQLAKATGFTRGRIHQLLRQK
jgi:hypothetical protein